MPMKSVFDTSIKYVSILDEHGEFDESLGKDLIPDDDLIRLYEHMVTCRQLDEVAFVRFALGLAVGLNSGADYLFLQQQLEHNNQQIEQFQSSIMHIETNADPDDMRDSVIAFWRSLSLEELKQKISDGMENFINLLALYLLKTILFPLGFFYLAIFVIRQLWRIDLSGWSNSSVPAG